jgi:hypothetical protein
LPHPPQLNTSVRLSTQVPRLGLFRLAQQSGALGGQRLPHAPQLSGSNRRSTQVPRHFLRGVLEEVHSFGLQ